MLSREYFTKMLNHAFKYFGIKTTAHFGLFLCFLWALI